MSIKEIEEAIQGLPPKGLVELCDWLEEYCEDHLELSKEFVDKIERAKKEIAEGKVRVRQP